MDVIEKRLDTVEREIKELKSKDIEIKEDMKIINSKLDGITEGQYEQKLINQKLDYTLGDFRKDLVQQSEEREEQKIRMKAQAKDTKETKRWQIGIVVAVLIPFLHSLFQFFFL
ncbi:DUF2951 family protein [Staphylococcus delphini]|uniref:DUF2951 family protein n=1 Tax=Staphylococcus delphini TaxID=53344 RepID=UPI0012D2FF4B|nr:DUF2951 family protein [Staphylococcus delphini]